MHDTVDPWRIAKECELFRTLPEAVGRSLVAGRYPISLRKGQVLFQRGEPADAFYVVLTGWMKLSRLGPGGEETIVHVVRAGESFAEAAMFLDRAFPVDAEAATDALLVRIDAESIRARMNADPSTAFAMLGSMSLRLRGLVDEIERLKGRRALARVAGFLLELCPADATGSASVVLPFEKALIAARLGITPESLSRALAKLRQAGVEVTGGRADVADCAVLAKLASGLPTET